MVWPPRLNFWSIFLARTDPYGPNSSLAGSAYFFSGKMGLLQHSSVQFMFIKGLALNQISWCPGVMKHPVGSLLNFPHGFSALGQNMWYVNIRVFLKSDFEKKNEILTSTIASANFWGIFYWNPKAFFIWTSVRGRTCTWRFGHPALGQNFCSPNFQFSQWFH